MRLDDERMSDNVEDRRGEGQGLGGFGGGGGGNLVELLLMLFMRGGLRGGGIVLLLLVGALAYFGVFSGGSSTSHAAPQHRAAAPADEQDQVVFIRKVLATTEDVWLDLFQKMRKTYVAPKLVLFSGSVSSACGYASAATGPFYCPADRKVYIDLSFYSVLSDRLGARGDAAQAYVIAHEVGHHVQKLLGISDENQAQRAHASEVESNRLSVKLELQADFYAGVWAHYADRELHLFEAGDLEECLNAASKIGDDALQRQATGHVRPETFTHGTSEQRVRAFKLGFETGDVTKGGALNGR